ncbi:MAG: alpha/beta hydrolase fold domain-containing protein [Pseudomonadota bacterium]
MGVPTHEQEAGIDTARIAIGGDSAGGNLAAVVAVLARDAGLPMPAHKVLVYPAIAAYRDSDSHLEFAQQDTLTRRLIPWFHEQYLDYEAGDHTEPRWAQLLTDDLSRLPSVTIVLAGCDALRDEGHAYATRLAEAGREVTLKVYEGKTHPFFSWSGAVDQARQAVTFAARQLGEALGDAPID